MMRILVLAAVLAAAPLAASAQSQKIYRCVDESGRAYYTEKPGRRCKPTGINSLHDASPERETAAPARANPAPLPPRQAAAAPRAIGQCASLKAGIATIENGPPRGDPKASEKRLAGLRAALQRDCGS